MPISVKGKNKNIQIIRGNIFTTNCQTIVNTVNCEGFMGAGIAYECRLRWPEMCERYKQKCKDNELTIGTLDLYKQSDKWILNFPTKNEWRYPSKMVYLEKGLKEFLKIYKSENITSIAFPLLGAQNGGLEGSEVEKIMVKYLEQCELEKIEIYHYHPCAKDDLYEKFKALFLELSDDEIREKSNLRPQYIKAIKSALSKNDIIPDCGEIRSLSQLKSVQGIGDKTLEKAFQFVMNNQEGNSSYVQLGLDFNEEK